jgi:hypothetical protein
VQYAVAEVQGVEGAFEGARQCAVDLGPDQLAER